MDERSDVHGLRKRLQDDYPHIPVDEIERQYDVVLGRYDDARIQAFVAVFVEREMRRWATTWNPTDIGSGPFTSTAA